MIDLLIIYDVDGWAYHHQSKALQLHAPEDFHVRLAPFIRRDGDTQQDHVAALDEVLGGQAPDVLFLLCWTNAAFVRQRLRDKGWSTRLVVSWNNEWPRLYEQFQGLFAVADQVVVSNHEYWVSAGRPDRSVPIPNGVDLAIFHVIQPLESRQQRVLWCGSECHRSINGYDAFILPLFERLRNEGIACQALLSNSCDDGNRSQHQMADWYNQGTIYVCTSETEDTPNPALEAAACGCTIVSTPVGNMPELIRNGENGLLVSRDLDCLHHAVIQAIDAYTTLSAQLQQDIQAWGWASRAGDFFRLFRRVFAEAPVRSRSDEPLAQVSVRDLSAEVTVFCITVGACSFDDCLAHLKSQNCRFRLEIIENVAPMSAAFQLMLDRCQTPYFIQVDEDMILRPWAIQCLLRGIQTAPPQVALVVGLLWDVHLGLSIEGVKAYRHDIVSRYPYCDVLGCEKDQLNRMLIDGYIHQVPPAAEGGEFGAWTLGLHGAHYTQQTIYERYSTLERHRIHYPQAMAWFESHAHDFLDRFRQDPSEMNFMALMGVVAATIAGSQPAGEKDFTTYSTLPGLLEARSFFAAFHSSQPSVPIPSPRDGDG
jgi:glycosyltransferase involved in cell wall biosynthesis